MLKESYFKTLQSLLERVYRQNEATLERLGPAMADSVERGDVIHAFGSGHSEMIGREIVGRAGGLICVSPVVDESGGFVENLPGYGRALAERHDRRHGMRPGEFLLAISNSGKNASPIDVALYAKEKGLSAVAVGSLDMCRQVESSHPSGKKLPDVADYALDNGGVFGDAIVEVPGQDISAGPTSTLAGALLLNLLQMEIIEELVRRGATPPLVQSHNTPGGKEANLKRARNYAGRLSKPF